MGKGVANTLTCSCNQGVVVEKISTNKMLKVGQASSCGSQSGSIYSLEGVFPTICACTHGYAIGNIYEANNKGDNMWENKLERFNFNMEEIRLFDSFAGMGALHKNLKKLGVQTNLIGLSEIEPDAIIAYAGVHIDDFKNLDFDFSEDKLMREELMNKNVGWDFIKQKSCIPRMKKEKLKLLYKADKLTKNYGDISILDYLNLPDFDLMNFSFCCQDLSNAGKQKGFKNDDGSHTRSGLVKYGLDIIKEKKPKLVMIENVKGLIQKKFINDFYDIIKDIEKCGYKCKYPDKLVKKEKAPTCLNAKDYGIPQNRERIFIICVREDVDIDFDFPKGFDSGIRLKDLLEDEVAEKYYLSEEIQKRFRFNGKENLNQNELNVVGSSAPDCRTIGQRDITYGINGVMSTLTATDYKQPKQILIENENKLKELGLLDIKGNEQVRRVYAEDGVSFTLNTMQGGNRQPKIMISQRLKEEDKIVCEQRCDEGLRFFKDNICGSLRTIDSCGDKRIIENRAIRGRYKNDKIEQSLEIQKENISNTLTTVQKDNVVLETQNTDFKEFRIRKLTPLECWRLMGFDDEDFYKVKELGLSDSALYKLAGNSIVVNVLYYIFKEVFKQYII